LEPASLVAGHQSEFHGIAISVDHKSVENIVGCVQALFQVGQQQSAIRLAQEAGWPAGFGISNDAQLADTFGGCRIAGGDSAQAEKQNVLPLKAMGCFDRLNQKQ